MNNYGIFVYTTHKNFSRCQKILETWGSNIENLFFYTDREPEANTKGNFIKVTDDDTYDSNVIKNLYAILDAQKRNYDWSLFLGDDNYLFKKNFESYINSQNNIENSIFGSELLGTWYNKRTNRAYDFKYLDGGGGILFNKTSLNNFVLLMDENLESYIDNEDLSKFSDIAIELIRQKGDISINTTTNSAELGPIKQRATPGQNDQLYYGPVEGWKEYVDGLYFGSMAPWNVGSDEMLKNAITLHHVNEQPVIKNGREWSLDKLWEYENNINNEEVSK